MASTTGEPLTSDAVAVPPEEFLCPISKQLMVDPVELVGTGRRYDAANIMHWLATHDTCPITRKKLSNKEVTPDRALKKAAEAWAASHGVALPPVPRYTPLHPEHGSATTGGAGAAGSTSYGPSEAAGEFRVDNMPGNKGQGACSCTRRKWAFTIVGLLLSAAAVAAGVGISMAKNKQEQLSGEAADVLKHYVGLPVCTVAPGSVRNWNGGAWWQRLVWSALVATQLCCLQKSFYRRMIVLHQG